jgi:peptidoglycan/xylan/chitin deacetylase (PgdA/CDA1 family)
LQDCLVRNKTEIWNFYFENQKHNQIAVYYIITNRLGNAGFIDADRVKDLAAKGMDIESHTVTHSTLTALSLKKLDSELTESKRSLEELTGHPVGKSDFTGPLPLE